jgi:phenylacetate-CoA ligase
MNIIQWLPKFRQAARDLQNLREREDWSRAQIEAMQIERLNDVWAHAVRHVPYYRELARRNGIPERFQTLSQFVESVPLLSRNTVRENVQQFLSEQAGHGGWIRTGGSTGLPTPCYWGRESRQRMLRTKYRHFDMWDVGIFDRVAVLWGHGASFAPGLSGRLARLRIPIEDKLRNRLRLSVYHLGSSDLRQYLRQIERFRPAAIQAYSTAAYMLAQEALETGFHCSSLKLVVVTAEPAYTHMVEAIEKAFQVPCAIEYGSSECGFLAGETPERTLRTRDDAAFLETLPGHNGKFDIVVTGLINRAFPLIRYAIGDVTDAPLNRPETGFGILENVLGRANDVLVCRSGRVLHPSFLQSAVDMSLPGVRSYRAHQNRDGHVNVQLELDNNRRPVATATFKRRFEEQLGGYTVNISIVDKIPTSPAGKHRWVFSDMDRKPTST